VDTLRLDAVRPEQLWTGLVCPDCGGVLRVEREGRQGYLNVVCRIGHRFDLTELLQAKEGRREWLLWAAFQALEEVAALTEDLRLASEARGLSGAAAAFAERSARARASARGLRGVVESDVPLRLDDEIHRLAGSRGRP
jgi:hypothetical protein